MPTKQPSSPTAASSSAGPVAPGSLAAPGAATAPSRPRRRVPSLVLALGGAAAAAAYGRLGLGMTLSPPFVMLALGGLTLVLAALALWRVLDPLTDDDVRAPLERRAPHRLRELEREKQAVLKAIKEIELDYQMRKIAENDYREMVERYRARALRVMGELAAGEDYRALIEHELKGRLAVIRATAMTAAGADAPEPPLAPSTAAVTPSAPEAPALASTGGGPCPACGTPNDPDARFCKRCGAAVATTGLEGTSAPK